MIPCSGLGQNFKRLWSWLVVLACGVASVRGLGVRARDIRIVWLGVPSAAIQALYANAAHEIASSPHLRHFSLLLRCRLGICVEDGGIPCIRLSSLWWWLLPTAAHVHHNDHNKNEHHDATDDDD